MQSRLDFVYLNNVLDDERGLEQMVRERVPLTHVRPAQVPAIKRTIIYFIDYFLVAPRARQPITALNNKFMTVSTNQIFKTPSCIATHQTL